jgi:hypothetical protein
LTLIFFGARNSIFFSLFACIACLRQRVHWIWRAVVFKPKNLAKMRADWFFTFSDLCVRAHCATPLQRASGVHSRCKR